MQKKLLCYYLVKFQVQYESSILTFQYNAMLFAQTVLYSIIFQIEEVWKYKMGIFSIPMTQGLPYEIFMRQLVFEMTERGQLNQVLKKWEEAKPDCGAILRSGSPLSWQKLITVFVIVKMGIILSLATLFIEKM